MATNDGMLFHVRLLASASSRVGKLDTMSNIPIVFVPLVSIFNYKTNRERRTCFQGVWISQFLSLKVF